MSVRRNRNRFQPCLDALPSRIAPTVYAPIDPVSLGSGDDMVTTTQSAALVQVMPTDANDMVGPSY